MLLTNQYAHGGPAGQTPVATDKVQLRLDVVDEQGHVVRQVEIRHLEDERVAEHRLSGDAVDLARSQGTYRPCGTTLFQEKINNKVQIRFE